jgi:hypothetical protein
VTLIIAELWRDGERVACWTDQDGPPDLANMLPALRDRGWTVYDFRGPNCHVLTEAERDSLTCGPADTP